jgi:predicted NAD/FAD-dependent oxidoreductase
MPTIAIVGAGAAGLAAAYELRDASVETIIFEKSDVLTGRAASRIRDGFVYDYGANYLKSDDQRVNELVTGVLSDGLVDTTEPVYTFDAAGTIEPGREADEHKWTYRDGLDTLGSRLAAAANATVEHGCRVEALERVDDQWRIQLEGSTTAGGPTEHGPFDAILLTPPAPQTAAILRETNWADDRRTTLADAAAAVPYRAICTIVAAYDRPVDRRWYALVNTDREHEIGWLAREECKPGHVPDGKSLLVIQPAPDWSDRRYNEPVDETVEEALALTAGLLEGGDSADPDWTDPEWTDYKGWRYALPDDGLDEEHNDVARDAGLYLAGDWVAGEARLHAALRSGLDVGAAIAADTTTSDQ